MVFATLTRLGKDHRVARLFGFAQAL